MAEEFIRERDAEPLRAASEVRWRKEPVFGAGDRHGYDGPDPQTSGRERAAD